MFTNQEEVFQSFHKMNFLNNSIQFHINYFYYHKTMFTNQEHQHINMHEHNVHQEKCYGYFICLYIMLSTVDSEVVKYVYRVYNRRVRNVLYSVSNNGVGLTRLFRVFYLKITTVLRERYLL